MKRMFMLLLLAVLAALAGCREDLHARLPEADANDMLDALYGAGISAGKHSADGKLWAVQVDSAELQRALRVLRDSGLPRQRFASTGELFKKEGLVSTPSEERIRFIFAVSQELAQTLSHIDGVIAARVHPVVPQNDPLVDKVRAASASVFIKHKRDANLEAMAPAIKNLVMRGIEGLSYDHISLTFVAAEEPLRPRASAAAATPDAAHLSLYAALGGGLVAALGALAVLVERAWPRWWRRRAVAVPAPASSTAVATPAWKEQP